MNVNRIFLYSCVALGPIAAVGALTLSGPGGTLALDDTYGALEPLVLAPIGGSNVLFQTALFVETEGSVFPEDVYFEGAPLGESSGPDQITLGYGLAEVSVEVVFRKSTPGDGDLPGSLVENYFIIEVAITNPNASPVTGFIANYFDFEMIGGLPDGDLLELLESSGATTFAQSNVGSPIVAYAATSNPVNFSSGQFPSLIENLFEGPLGAFTFDGPSPGPLDWTFAFEQPFALDPGERERFVYAIGTLDLANLPKPRVGFALGADDAVELSWEGVAGVNYGIYVSNDLEIWSLQSTQPGVNGRNEATVMAPASGRGFCRVGAGSAD